MRVSRVALGTVVGLALALPPRSAAQAPAGSRSSLEGRWEARGPDDAIHHIMVRGDSSAQFGNDVARWRVVGDSLWLTLGDGVWMVYGMALRRDRLTLSGGDLEKPVTLRRAGLPTPRPADLQVPEPPPASARAW
jgi:hypothetical protein